MGYIHAPEQTVNQRLTEILETGKNHRKMFKALEFQHRGGYHGQAYFYSTRSHEIIEQESGKAEELRNTDVTKLEHFSDFIEKNIAQERGEQRARRRKSVTSRRLRRQSKRLNTRAKRKRGSKLMTLREVFYVLKKGKRKASIAS